MEINKQSDVTGVVTTEDITEGRMVLFTSHPGYNSDLTGRLEDVPGVKLPDDASEASEAKYVLTWPVDNRETPIVYWPSYSYGLRQTFDRDTNAPVTGKTIYLTYPGYQESVTIPSGHQALAMGGGVYTVPSGQYIYDASMQTPGTSLYAADASNESEANAGKLTVTQNGKDAVAVTERFDSDTYALTFRTLAP
jgi:hypothetical protein